MIFQNIRHFGEIEAYEYGYSPFGMKKLLYTVHFFRIGDTLIDSGSVNTRKALPSFADRPPEQILLTHHHEDHSGNAHYLHKKYGSPVYGHPLTADLLGSRFPMQTYERIMFGIPEPVQVTPFPEEVHIGKFPARVLHIPGHSTDHCCLFVPEKGWLFSGDMYVADRIRIWRKTENIRTQVAGLKQLLTLDFDTLLCAHNPQEKNGKERLRAKLGFFEEFIGKVSDHAKAGLPVAESMKRMKRREDWPVRLMTRGDVSVENMFLDVYFNAG